MCSFDWRAASQNLKGDCWTMLMQVDVDISHYWSTICVSQENWNRTMIKIFDAYWRILIRSRDEQNLEISISVLKWLIHDAGSGGMSTTTGKHWNTLCRRSLFPSGELYLDDVHLWGVVRTRTHKVTMHLSSICHLFCQDCMLRTEQAEPWRKESRRHFLLRAMSIKRHY